MHVWSLVKLATFAKKILNLLANDVKLLILRNLSRHLLSRTARMNDVEKCIKFWKAQHIIYVLSLHDEQGA